MIPELSNSPNLRYKEENYDMITGSLEKEYNKQSTVETSDNKNPSPKQQSPVSKMRHLNELSNSIKGDSIVEYECTDEKELQNESDTEKYDNVVFNIKIDENQYAEDVVRNSLLKDKQEYINMKSRAYTAQMPLHSISEDINSPYFASSTSNIYSRSNRQKTPNGGRSPIIPEGEQSNSNQV